MAYQKASADDPSSPDPADGSNLTHPESNSTLHSRNPFRRQLSSPNSNIRGHNEPLHDIDIGRDGAGNDTGLTNKGLGILAGYGKSEYSPVASMPTDSSNATQSGLSPAMSSPGFPRAQLSRKDTRQSMKSVAWDVSGDQGSLHSSPYIPNVSSSDRELLSPYNPTQAFESGLPGFDCQTDGAIIKGRWSWLSVTLILLAVYSTVLSAIFLVIALVEPRYGKKIGTNGHMTISTASLLSAAFAKTVELSFVTVFVAFLGQVLSRRAFLAKARGGGISIAEMMCTSRTGSS